MSFIFSVREIYELRNIKRESPRVCVARLFVHDNKFGVKDISGALWPIEFKSKNLKSGDVIQFYGKFGLSSPLDPRVKLRDDTIGFIFSVEKILTIVNQTDVWKRKQIQVPLDIEINKKFGSDTLYFPFVKNKNRFNLVQLRNLALERTKQFFSNRSFFYAETPVLVPSGGMETYLHTFQTKYRDFRGREWTFELPTSPEFALKKLIAEGIPKIFQVSRAFRNNGELSALHEPEFMMLEWYRVGGTLNDILIDTQKLVHTLAQYLNSKHKIPKKWKIFSVSELFLNILNLNLEKLQNTKDFYEKGKNHSLSLRESDTWDDIFCKLFMEKIEPFLKKQIACFVTGYPVQMSALATQEKNNPLFVQRAEAYLFGVEICNGYQELVDSVEFENRFQKTQLLREGNVRRDTHFENVMNYGLPPCAGNAVGIDRVIALLLGLENIQELFPIPFSIQKSV